LFEDSVIGGIREMFWIHDNDNLKIIIRYAEWRLSGLLPGLFQKYNPVNISDKFESIGKMTGLVSNEVEAAVDSNTTLFELVYHKFLKWILLAILIVGGAYIIRRATYVPGTLYGSIKISDVS
jgi:hypothetical protein